LLNITYATGPTRAGLYFVGRFNLDTVDKLYPIHARQSESPGSNQAMVANRGVPLNWLFTGEVSLMQSCHPGRAQLRGATLKSVFARILASARRGDQDRNHRRHDDGIFVILIAVCGVQAAGRLVMIGMNDARRGPNKKDEFGKT
jgi:hypothetical protein